MKYTTYMQSSIGLLGISENDGLITALFLEKDASKGSGGQKTSLLEKAEKQLTEYLSGSRKKFELPLGAEGTAFQKSVWCALREIPYGETRSYKEVAKMIGNPNASRAVGMANNKNPLLIVTPCHRVVGVDGKLVGYAAGLDIKEKLLDMERKHVKS